MKTILKITFVLLLVNFGRKENVEEKVKKTKPIETSNIVKKNEEQTVVMPKLEKTKYDLKISN